MELREGYKNTEVGVIPEDWEVQRLAECSVKITDGEHITPKREESGFFLLSARNILNSKIDTSDVDFVGKVEYLRIRQRCNPEFGDVLISCSGTIGRVATVPENFECVMVRSAALIKTISSKINNHYIQYYLQSQIGQNQIFASMNQGAQPNLFLNHIQNLRVALPPTKNEQTAIATALSDADALINSLEKLIAKKRNIKQGAMQHLLKPKEGWEMKKLGEIAEIYTGKRNNQDKVENGEYPFFVRSQTVERINTYSFEGEAILVPGEGNIGKIFHYINGKFDFHQRVYKISDFKIGYIGKYIYRYISENFGKHALENSVKATVDSLRLPTFQVFEIPFPPTVQEQNVIATILSDMDTELQALETKLEKYRKIKTGMMQNLLTGKIRLIEN